MEVVWKATGLLYVAVLEFARASATLLVPPFRTWAPSVAVRSAVEAAAQAMWLFEPKITSGRTRIGRYYTLRRYMAGQLEYTFNKVASGGSLSDYGVPKSVVEAEAAQLNLDPVRNKKNDIIGYEGQKMERIDDLVPLIVGANGAYSVLSGSSHSEFWSLLGGYQGTGASALGVTPSEHEADPESFISLVRVCLQSLFKPIDLARHMFDRGALAKDIDRAYNMAVAVLGA